jgi:hypothetical protein
MLSSPWLPQAYRGKQKQPVPTLSRIAAHYVFQAWNNTAVWLTSEFAATLCPLGSSLSMAKAAEKVVMAPPLERLVKHWPMTAY